MRVYDKDEIKNKLSTDMVFDIIYEFGGDPKMTNFGFIAATICHNHPGEGSHKLYFYENTRLFKCYTECDSTFDIFELISKIKKWGLYDSVKWVAARYNWAPSVEQESPDNELPDWAVFDKYQKIAEDDTIIAENFQLPEYDDSILRHLSYPRIGSWIAEGMTPQALAANKIGYFAGGEQITIPHYDINGRFIGLRGRSVSPETAELYGKYRPVFAGGTLYNHPLGLNLYGLNRNKENIKIAKKVIIAEGEKSVIKCESYFGAENNISVACCGSAISAFQIKLLLSLGVTEIIVGFDKQFQERGDDEFKHLVKNLKNIHQKYHQYATISFMFDKENLLGYKESPMDRGPEIFQELYKNRIFLK